MVEENILTWKISFQKQPQGKADIKPLLNHFLHKIYIIHIIKYVLKS